MPVFSNQSAHRLDLDNQPCTLAVYKGLSVVFGCDGTVSRSNGVILGGSNRSFKSPALTLHNAGLTIDGIESLQSDHDCRDSNENEGPVRDQSIPDSGAQRFLPIGGARVG
jgi:hypothetical protein